MTRMKPNIYLTSPVFFKIAQHNKVSPALGEKILELKSKLEEKSNLNISSKRFPTGEEICDIVEKNNVDFIGCHLSHPILEKTIQIPTVKGVSTSTAGFNHIYIAPDVIYTHTPGVLDRTVADFTIAMILANLRNIIALHNFTWNGSWSSDQKWDLDENLNNVMDKKVVGLIGLGEIGLEVAKRLLPWGIKIRYYDLVQNKELEKLYDNLSFEPDVDTIFSQCDIVSLHIPLNKHTKHYVNESRLKLMKKGALLVNTARGPIVNFEDLLSLMENQEIEIDLCFDVWDPEPISEDVLSRLKSIKEKQPERRFVFMPHNASSDADTRAQMSVMVLEDLLRMISSTSPIDLKDLRFIPSLRKFNSESSSELEELKTFRIAEYWS